MKIRKKMPELDLFIFEDGAGQQGAAGEAAPPALPAASEETNEAARRAEFERLIREEYKDLYDERAQSMINRRFRAARAAEKRLAEQDEFISALKANLGAQDTEDILRMTSKEPESIERDGIKNGRNYARWEAQCRKAAELYPQFDMQGEVLNSSTGIPFMELLASGVDVMTAYEVVHKDELIGGAMKYTAEKVREKTVNDIRARGLRPDENGADGAAALMVGSDPSSWPDEEIDRVIERAKRGERIVL